MSSNKNYSASYQRATRESAQPALAASDIKRAMRQPENFEPILVCSVVFIVVGMLMMVIGGVICLIYYTEITPPNFDSNYHRYVGSSMPRIVGPLLVAFGGLLSAGGLVVIGLTVLQYQRKSKPPSQVVMRRRDNQPQAQTSIKAAA